MARLFSMAALLLAVAAGLTACGGDKRDAAQPGEPATSELARQLHEATSSSADDFPPVAGKTLQQVADGFGATGPEVGLASSVFTPGENRLPFGVIDRKSGFVYAKTAVYVGSSPDAPAQGPYPAPADLLITAPAFRSQTAASEDDPFAAVYEAKVPFQRPGRQFVLVASLVKNQLVGATADLRVVSDRRDRVPGVGESAPRVSTDTKASAGGDIKSIETRVPPDDMHETNFKDVVGRKPVALLFATPQLCHSRVCGPVVDIAAQLKRKYGDRMTFIHQEVYVDNELEKGLRPPLLAFNLQTEPWLFTVDRTGKVAARLEGSFGFRAFERAIKAAL